MVAMVAITIIRHLNQRNKSRYNRAQLLAIISSTKTEELYISLRMMPMEKIIAPADAKQCGRRSTQISRLINLAQGLTLLISGMWKRLQVRSNLRIKVGPCIIMRLEQMAPTFRKDPVKPWAMDFSDCGLSVSQII